MAKQDLTMNDVTKGTSSNKVYFTTKPEIITGKTNKHDYNLEGFEKQIKSRKDYNDNIDNFSENYNTFKPYQGILVRVYLRELNIVGGKLFAGDTPGFDKIQIPSQNVQGATWRTIDNPFPFATKCIVVATPKHIDNFKKGDVLAIPQLQALPVRKGDDSAIIYEHFFVHPDSGIILPTQDIESDDFGYAIIPSAIIQGFLK